MTVFQIKVLAVAAMVVSHAGIFFFPQYEILRIAGTIAFPLFAWLIANGARHTRAIDAYAARLFCFAVIAQVPFALANGIFDRPLVYLNVFFTLFLGLFAIRCLQRYKSALVRVLAALGCIVLTQVLNTDYGASGVLAILAFHLFFDRFWLMAASQGVILGVLPVVTFFLGASYGGIIPSLYNHYHFEWVGLAALFFIARYNGERGYPAQYLFYLFYPAHYVVIIALQALRDI